jgi:hypothetical protein
MIKGQVARLPSGWLHSTNGSAALHPRKLTPMKFAGGEL